MADVNAKLKLTVEENVTSSLSKAREEMEKLESASRSTKGSLDGVLGSGGLQRSKTTLGDLEGLSKSLTGDIKGMTLGTTEFVQKSAELRQVNTRIRSIRDEIEGVKQTGGLENAIGGFAGKFGLSAAGLGYAAAGAGLAVFLRQSLEAASALEALERRAQIVYGEAFPRMAAEASQLAQKVNRSSSDILDFMTDITALTSGIGIATDATEEMSKEVAELAVDFASYANISDTQSFDMISSALRGNARALAAYSVTMTENELETYRLAKGYKTAVKDMGDAQLMILRLNFLLDKLSKVEGEAAKSAGSLANRTKDLTGQWKDFQETVGGPLSTFASEQLWVINTTLRAIGNTALFAMDSVYRLGRTLVGLPNAPFEFGPPKKPMGPATKDQTFWKNALNPDDYPEAPGGGGGGETPADKALERAKKLLTDIKDIEQDIVDSLGKQAAANKKVQEGLLADLKLKQAIGTITEKELRQLERLNDRLGDGRDRINDLKDAWEKQKDVVEDLKKKVDELNSEILKGAQNLQKELEKLDRDTTRRKGEKIADLIKEQKELNDQLARGEGLSQKEQERIAEIDRMLREAREGGGSPRMDELNRMRSSIIGSGGAMTEANLSKLAAIDAELTSLRGNNPDAYALGEQLSNANDLEQIDMEAKRKRLDVVLEFNKKQEDSVNELTQATLDLGAAESQVKQLKIDLQTEMGKYETKMLSTYTITEEATKKHVANQVTELQKEIDTVNALAAAYAKVATYLKDEKETGGATTINQRASGGMASGLTLVGERGPELVSLPTGSYVHNNRDSQKMVRGGDVYVTVNANISKEVDADSVIRQITRAIQLQQLQAA